MKRKNEKVPEFDEIIFENRNKTYGAYKLRKSYKSVASLSILGGIAFATILLTALSFTTEDGTASTRPIDVILILGDPIITEVVNPPEVKPPAELINSIANLQPVITEDTSATTDYIPTAEEINSFSTNGNVIDTNNYIEVSEPAIPVDNTPRIIADEMPEYPGGNTELLKFIGENLKYPEEALDIRVQGRVNLKFVVNTDGSVDRIEVLKGVDPLLDNEAIRVVKALPKFKPGKQGGIPVPVWFSLPVTFKITDN